MCFLLDFSSYKNIVQNVCFGLGTQAKKALDEALTKDSFDVDF